MSSEPAHEKLLAKVIEALERISVANGYWTDPRAVVRLDEETDVEGQNPERPRPPLIEVQILKLDKATLGEEAVSALDCSLGIGIDYFVAKPDDSESLDRVLALAAHDLETALFSTIDWKELHAYPETYEIEPFHVVDQREPMRGISTNISINYRVDPTRPWVQFEYHKGGW